jgi:hypothetical protein
VLGEPELTEASSATHALNNVVASLGAAAGGDGGDAGQALSQFDIGYVLLPAPVDQALARQLDGAAGLVRLTTAPAYDLWQVAGTVARARVTGAVAAIPSGQIGVNTTVPPGTSGTLVLAEAAGGWSATLNGRPLAKLTQPVDGWAQGFVLPAGGGHLVITRDELARDLSLGAEAAAVLIVFALALPGTRSAVPAPAAEARAEPAPVPGRRRARAGAPKPATAPRPEPEPRPEPRPEPEPAAESAAQPEPWTIPAASYPPPRTEPPVDHGPAPAPVKRPRGGQHAARHGKPSRRWRGPARQPASDDQQTPATQTMETVPADGEDLSPWVTPDPMTTGSHAPWESGDRS